MQTAELSTEHGIGQAQANFLESNAAAISLEHESSDVTGLDNTVERAEEKSKREEHLAFLKSLVENGVLPESECSTLESASDGEILEAYVLNSDLAQGHLLIGDIGRQPETQASVAQIAPIESTRTEEVHPVAAALEIQEKARETEPAVQGGHKARIVPFGWAELKPVIKSVAEAKPDDDWVAVYSQVQGIEHKYGFGITLGSGFTPEQSQAIYGRFEKLIGDLPPAKYQKQQFKPVTGKSNVRSDKTIELDVNAPDAELKEFLKQHLNVGAEEIAQTAGQPEVQHLQPNTAAEIIALQAPEQVKTVENGLEGINKTSDALKQILGGGYKEFLNGMVGLSARELNKIQTFKVSEFLAFYNHDQASPTQLKDYKVLFDSINSRLDKLSPSELVEAKSETLKEFLIQLAQERQK
jgi:hypothetical protein